jgi:hypothetical protein
MTLRNAVCVENEESITAFLNEELDTGSDDLMDLENVEETVSEYQATKCRKVRGVKRVLRVDGWEDVTMSDQKPKAYTFTKNAWPQFNLLPDAEPRIILVYFSMTCF